MQYICTVKYITDILMDEDTEVAERIYLIGENIKNIYCGKYNG